MGMVKSFAGKSLKPVSESSNLNSSLLPLQVTNMIIFFDKNFVQNALST